MVGNHQTSIYKLVVWGFLEGQTAQTHKNVAMEVGTLAQNMLKTTSPSIPNTSQIVIIPFYSASFSQPPGKGMVLFTPKCWAFPPQKITFSTKWQNFVPWARHPSCPLWRSVARKKKKKQDTSATMAVPNALVNSRWFNSWPFHPLFGGHVSPSQKGQDRRLARCIFKTGF